MITITATCVNGHTHKIHVEGRSREWAEALCGLLDGTSPFFVTPPGPESMIGKCGICEGALRCEVQTE